MSALPVGQRFEDWGVIPPESFPEEPLADIRSLPTGQGIRQHARTAADGTKWCLTCMTAFDSGSRQSFCETCKRERDRIRRGERRRATDSTTVRVPAVALEQLIRRTRHLEIGIAQVLTAVTLNQSVEAPGRRLARASKEIAALVGREIEPRVADVRRIQRY